MPCFQGLLGFGGHGFEHVVIEGRKDVHVRLVLRKVELVREVALAEFRQSKGFGKGGQRHLEETERIDETGAIVLDFQQFASVPELLHKAVVAVVLVDDKVPIVPLEIMSEHIDLTRVVQRERIQPFQKIAETMLAWETNGTIVVFRFGHDQIGDVLFVGLHGFNVKKHVQGWTVVVDFLLRLRFIGLQGLKSRGHPSFGTRTSLTFPLPLLFLLLRRGGSLNETTVGVAVHVLVAGRTFQVPALMPLKGLGPHFLLEAITTATSTKAHGGLGVRGGFARMVNSEMRLETSLSEKVPMTSLATSCGFQTSGVRMKEIRALFLATGPAKTFFVASMAIFVVIGFPTVGTHVTGSEKPRQTGNDIVMVLVVQQDQLFVLGVSKRRDMEGPVGIH